MSDLKKKTKKVEMCGKEIDVVFTEMIRPTTKEKLEEMDPETREDYKYLPPLNTRNLYSRRRN